MSSNRFEARLARPPSPAMLGPWALSGSPTVAEAVVERAAKLAYAAAASPAY